MAGETVRLFQSGRGPRTKHAAAGFSLVEALVVIAIVSILLGLAVPSYQRYVQRGQRADAIRAMLEAVACQERIRAGSGHYDTTRCLENRDTGHYRLGIEPAGEPDSLLYTLTATPFNRRADDDCGDLSIDNAGTRRISGSPDRLTACWGGR